MSLGERLSATKTNEKKNNSKLLKYSTATKRNRKIVSVELRQFMKYRADFKGPFKGVYS